MTATQQPSRPTTSHNREDGSFNILQLNGNRISNKLSELEMVLDQNKIKVAAIQESKLTSRSQKNCIKDHTTVRRDVQASLRLPGPPNHNDTIKFCGADRLTLSGNSAISRRETQIEMNMD